MTPKVSDESPSSSTEETLKERGVKSLVSKYEKKQTTDEGGPNLTDKNCDTSCDSLSYYSSTAAPTTTYTISTPHSTKTCETDVTPLDQSKSSAIKKMIQHYEKNPLQESTGTTSSGAVEEKDEDNTSSLATVSLLDEKRQSSSGISKRSEVEEEKENEEDNVHDDHHEVPLESKSVGLYKDIVSSIENIPRTHLFHNKTSDLTAVLYLAEQNDLSKFKVFLKGKLFIFINRLTFIFANKRFITEN